MTGRILAVLALTALTAAGCDQPDDQETGSISREEVEQARQDLGPEVLEALDAGNEAYRAGNYEEALELYRQANEAHVGGGVAAAWFGIYMAELALGNEEAASEAMETARELAPESNLIRPTPEPNQ